MTVFVPRAPQEKMIEHALQHPRCALFAGMGIGKTSSSLAVLDALSFTEDVYPALVLAPKLVCTTTWPAETKKWDNFQHLTVTPIVGGLKDRVRAIKRDTAMYAANYESLPWLVEHFGSQWPFKTVVADESTHLKSFRAKQGGVRARALASVAHTKVDRFIALSGTPAPNGLQDLWGQLWMLDKGKRLGTSYTSFIDRWFARGYNGYGVRISHESAREEIYNRIRDICLSIRTEDYFDLDKPIVTRVGVPLPERSRRVYEEVKAFLIAELKAHRITAANAAVKSVKLLQIANGACYAEPEVDDDDDPRSRVYVELHDAKLQALESIVTEASGMPVLVSVAFRSDRERILKHFKGAMDIKDDNFSMAKWNRGDIPILTAHPKSAGHGLNLQDGSNIIVYFGHSWVLEHTQQILERVGPMRQHQSGHKRNVFVYQIVAEDTMDDVVISRSDEKKSVQDLLLENLT